MSNSGQWSQYLNQPQYNFTMPNEGIFRPTQLNHSGNLGNPAEQQGLSGASNAVDAGREREDAMQVSRPSSVMEGEFVSGGNMTPLPGLTPTETRRLSPAANAAQFATPAPRAPALSTLQTIISNGGANGSEGRTADAYHDVFSRTPAPAELFRSGGDLTQFVDKYSAALSLDAGSRKQLQKILELRSDERTVMFYAMLVKVLQASTGVSKAGPNTSIVTAGVPPRAAGNIVRWAHRILLIPEIESYENPVPQQLLLKVVRKWNWDLPPKWHEDDEALKVVTMAVQDAITQRKSTIKRHIENSCGIDFKGTRKTIPTLNIVELARKLLAYGRNQTLSNTEVTTELCARVAYLRKSRVEVTQEKSYWKYVSDGLGELRKETAANPIDATRALGKILDEDRESYKRPDLTNIRRANPSALQSELSTLATTGAYNGETASHLDDNIDGAGDSDAE